LYGTYPGVLLYADKRALLFTREGLNIVRPLMVGGATTMYCGCSSAPLPWWSDRHGIELDRYAEETVRELHIAPLPPELRGDASTRVAVAASELGMTWRPQDKFMQPARARRFDCGAKCMLGCRCGAKWTAGEYVDDAVAAGARLFTNARIDRVQHSNRVVSGLSGRLGRQPFEVEANTVIVAAGGIGTPVLLRNSGLDAAGRGMAMDITTMVYGLTAGKGMGHDPPMTWSFPDDELGVLYSTLVDPWLMYPIIMTRKGPAYPLTWHRWGRTIGVMIKLKDEISGEVDARGVISKGLTAADHLRLSQAERVAGRILERAGCDPKTIFTTPLRGTHPSASVRIGEMLSTELETEIQGLYVCDASVFPEALARPTVLTIISLAKRLAERLTAS
jgi:choline dehydrogenase-like flavoprotein